MTIDIHNIYKHYGDVPVLKDVSLTIEPGELVALLGPSGSGKTTLLRIIAGLDVADSGHVLLDGMPMHARHVRERRVGFVFQHYALFRHMSVFENVAFGLRVRSKETRPTDAEIRRKVMDLLSLVHLDAFAARYPSQLSGGQRQRVALARALAVEPKLLLLDEPFGALDAKVRKELRRWMRRLHDEIQITSIFVTHDQEEAMEVADRVVVMHEGRIEQSGTPGEVYYQPASGFVYDFLGNYNEFDGWRDEGGAIHLLEYDAVSAVPATAPAPRRGWLARYPEIGNVLSKLLPGVMQDGAVSILPRVRRQPPSAQGKRVRLFARPHEMFIARTASDGHEYITARVIHLNPAGPLIKLELERRNGSLLEAEIPKDVVDQLRISKHDTILVRPKQTRVFE